MIRNLYTLLRLFDSASWCLGTHQLRKLPPSPLHRLDGVRRTWIVIDFHLSVEVEDPSTRAPACACQLNAYLLSLSPCTFPAKEYAVHWTPCDYTRINNSCSSTYYFSEEFKLDVLLLHGKHMIAAVIIRRDVLGASVINSQFLTRKKYITTFSTWSTIGIPCWSSSWSLATNIPLNPVSYGTMRP